MSASVPAVILAAGGVGIAHTVLPDHWLPLAVVSRARKDPLRRIARLALFAGIAHVIVSVILGAIIAAIGLSLRSEISDKTDLVVGVVLIVTGIAFLVADATGRSHAAKHRAGGEHSHSHGEHDHGEHDHGAPAQHDHEHDEHGHEDHAAHGHDHDEAPKKLPRGAALLVPFGAAASPDLTVLPVFLAAAALGTGPALGALAVFTIATLATFVGLTTLAAAGGRQLRSPLIDKYSNVITAVVLIGIGILVAVHIL